MNKLILLLCLVLSSSAIAQLSNTTRASKIERIKLCRDVNALLERQKADAALDMKDCLRNATISSILFSEGIIVVEGSLKINTPDYFTKVNCGYAYNGSLNSKNTKIISPTSCN
jgi:hypothetical protein